jgi:serine protease AprX
MRIERAWLEELIFAGEAPRRFTQDSPVLPDVWLAYAEAAREADAKDLLITPYRDAPPGQIVKAIREVIHRSPQYEESAHDIAHNEAVVAVRLAFAQLIKVTLVLSPWWKQHALLGKRRLTPDALRKPALTRALVRALEDLSWRQLTNERLLQPPPGRSRRGTSSSTTRDFTPGFLWFIRVAGTIALGLRTKSTDESVDERLKSFSAIAWNFEGQVRAFVDLLPPEVSPTPLIFLVSLNRPATLAIDRSVPAIKADAAIRLFNIRCNRVCWAIVDSGVDARHPAFRVRDKRGRLAPIPRGHDASAYSRVRRTFDFTRIRALLNPMRSEASYLQRVREQLAAPTRSQRRGARTAAPPDVATAAKRLRALLLDGRAIDWGLLVPLLEVQHGAGYVAPVHDHGTHVSGILASDWRRSDFRDDDPLHPGDEDLVGVCPDIELFDFRIFSGDATSDEFAIMGALQFIRWLNQQGDQPLVHGANLSLAIRHDVTNFACGRTPVCSESTRLVNSGVVVVAAAGNEGRAEFSLASGGRSEGYRSISISDPGNTEEVITVGATHRHQPHTYGVSYFSSRGPTGDGRSKPDLVAPGEKITAPVPQGSGTKDGTSMAAPHVSGAAALLLARHRELLGSPQRVKEILCSTATDLGRERYFQGAGLVDVLRAIQAV